MFSVLSISLIIVLSTNLINAQETTGSLQGYVVDTTGAPLEGVNIAVSGTDLQGIRGTASDGRGHFQIANLPVGSYKVELSIIGFRKTIYENVVLRLGSTTNLGTVKMIMQAVGLDEIIVSDEKPLLDPASTTIGGNIASKDFNRLPIGRDYKDIAVISPYASTSYFFGDNINISGSTGLENKYFIDGVDVTDPYLGSDGTDLPYNFIREVQLMAGGYNAETRSALGGALNVITNSGTNEFHGSAYGFFTSNGLTGYEKLGLLDPTQGNFTDYDFGFGLGGPVVRDKLWFYIAYNPWIYRREVDVPGFGNSTDKSITHKFAAKFNWTASNQLNFVFTVNGDPTVRDAVRSPYDIPPERMENPDPYLYDNWYGGLNLSLKANYTIGNNLLLKASIDRITKTSSVRASTEKGANEIFFRDMITNVWSGGVQGIWDNDRLSTEVRISGAWLVGDHNIRSGVEYKTTEFNAFLNLGEIRKLSDTNYVKHVITNDGEVRNKIPTFYIHDNWKIARSLNIYGGIRWEAQDIIGTNNQVAQNINVPLQPRAGFTYLIGNEGLHRVYGSFGRYVQELSLRFSIWNYSDKSTDSYIWYDHDPRIDDSDIDSTRSSRTTINPNIPDLEAQYFDEFSLGFETLLGEHFKLGIQGLYRTLRSAVEDAGDFENWQWINGNPGKGALADWPEAERKYYGLTLTLQHFGHKHFNFLASYTLSRNYGNYAGLYDAFHHHGLPNEAYDFDALALMDDNIYGLLPNDRTHVFKFSGYYNFSFGLTAGIMFTAQSGTPLSVLGLDQQWDWFISMPEPRGTAGRTDFTWDLNMRFIYEIPLLVSSSTRLILDLYHIASQRKPVDMYQFKYSIDLEGNIIDTRPNYGQPYGYQPPMAIRFGVEVNF